MTDYRPLLDFARHLAQETTALIMPHYYNCIAEFKPDGSEVTEADRSAERRMRELIHAAFPQHRVLGEEYGTSGPEQGDFQWILDPVDGTHWLPLGVPTFGTLIGLLEKGKPVVGVIAFPAMHEVVYAAAGMGCWYASDQVGPVKVTVKREEKLAVSYCSASGPHHSDIRPATAGIQVNLSAYMRAAGRFRFIGDCLQHALVCRGRIQAALDVVMKPWDIAALVPCVEEAGGMATSLSSRSEDVVFGGSLLSSCGGSLHQEILTKLGS